MTILALPSIPGIKSLNWKLARNVAVAESPLGGTVQRVVRAGNPWLFDLNFPEYLGDNAGLLSSWLVQASRGDRWFYLSPPQNSVRGNWNPLDLISNGRFRDGVTTGWTATSATLSVNARTLKIKNPGAAQGNAYQDVMMEAGKPHVLLADGYRGLSTNGIIEVHRTAGGFEYGTGNTAVPTRFALLGSPTVAAMRIVLWSGTAVNGDDTRYGGVSLTRCLQVNGAGQSGTRLNVDGGPASINAALKAGEFVCLLVGTLYQLIQLTEDFDTDSTGAGTLVFEPVLRGSPADNAAVIVRNPFVRCFLPEHMAEERIRAPIIRGISLSGAEDITS